MQDEGRSPTREVGACVIPRPIGQSQSRFLSVTASKKCRNKAKGMTQIPDKRECVESVYDTAMRALSTPS